MMVHPPKVSAIEAWLGGQLSPQGRDRLLRHLSTCDVCTATLASARLYQELRKTAESTPPPETRWEDLAARLDTEPTPQKASPLLRGAGYWAIATAAAGILGWWSAPPAPIDTPRALTSVSAIEEPPRARLIGRVTLVAGEVERLRGGELVEVTLDTPVHEGDQLRTGEHGVVHVRLSNGTGFRLGENGGVQTATLRDGSAHLALTRGELTSRVGPLGADDSYTVGADPWLIEVRGTHFAVQRNDGEGSARVTVHEGTVRILRDGIEMATLEAGQSMTVPRPAKSRSSACPAVYGLSDELPLGRVALPQHDRIRAWRIHGQPLPAAGNLALRVPTGRQGLQLEDHLGRLHTVEIDATDHGTLLEANVVDRILAGGRTEAREGTLPPHQIRSVLRAGAGELRRCYEHDLRLRASPVGKVQLTVRVAPDGHVARARLGKAPPLSPELSACLLREVARWRFPEPQGGGNVTFQIPLNLKTFH